MGRLLRFLMTVGRLERLVQRSKNTPDLIQIHDREELSDVWRCDDEPSGRESTPDHALPVHMNQLMEAARVQESDSTHINNDVRML